MKILNIVETAFRATLEEQDDTVLWITTALRGAGCDNAVLLSHNAVGYGVKGQDASGLKFGDMKQTQPPRLAQDLRSLMEKGAAVYLVADDLADRGIRKDELIDGLELVARADLPKLLGGFDRVWHW